MDDKLFPDTSAYYKKTQKRPKGILAIVFLLILLVIGIFLGIRYFGGEAGTTIQGIVPVTPTPTDSITPTAALTPADTGKEGAPSVMPAETSGTPTPTEKTAAESGRGSLSIAVQNGSGVAGAAAGVSQDLRDLGYNVVSTGNAETFDYEDVTIQVKATKKSMLAQLEDDLSEDYTISAATADLTGSTADALVIIGK